MAADLIVIFETDGYRPGKCAPAAEKFGALPAHDVWMGRQTKRRKEQRSGREILPLRCFSGYQ